MRVPALQCRPTRYEVDATNNEVHDLTTGLIWQRSIPSLAVDYPTAAALCAMNAGWRVPSVGELETIVDETAVNPAIDKVVFPNPPLATWAAEFKPPLGSARRWFVGFDTGGIHFNEGTMFAVRCVH